MKLNIIIPIYNEEENLPELYQRVKTVCNATDMDWHIIYVNDGSTDASLQIMLQQCDENKNISVIELSRNFGLQAALAAGLAFSDSDVVILMDGDLQDPPELISELLEKWKNGSQIVLPQKQSRQERGIRKLGFDGFHKLFAFLTDFPVVPQTGIFGLLDRQVVGELKQFNEKNRFFPGLRSWVGFNQHIIPYDRPDRVRGVPKQTLKRLIRYAFDAVFSFSIKPLRIISFTGLFISGSGFIFALFFILKRLLGIEIAQTGFTTIISITLFLGGVQLLAVGVLGEYLVRIYDEVKQRPLFIIKNIHGPNPLQPRQENL